MKTFEISQLPPRVFVVSEHPIDNASSSKSAAAYEPYTPATTPCSPLSARTKCPPIFSCVGKAKCPPIFDCAGSSKSAAAFSQNTPTLTSWDTAEPQAATTPPTYIVQAVTQLVAYTLNYITLQYKCKVQNTVCPIEVNSRLNSHFSVTSRTNISFSQKEMRITLVPRDITSSKPDKQVLFDPNVQKGTYTFSLVR